VDAALELDHNHDEQPMSTLKHLPGRGPTKFCYACGAQIDAGCETCPDCEARLGPPRFVLAAQGRREQFLLTVAVVGFNVVALMVVLFADQANASFWRWAVTAVSGVGVFQIVRRWLVMASRRPPDPPDPEVSLFGERFIYTLRELFRGVFSLPYIVTECGSTLLYGAIIVLTCIAVWLRS
jgi:hypothetical protein